MHPDKIVLDNMNKLFEYEKLSRDIDSINDIETLKNMSKSYIKLYLKQQDLWLLFFYSSISRTTLHLIIITTTKRIVTIVVK